MSVGTKIGETKVVGELILRFRLKDDVSFSVVIVKQ